MKKVIYSNQTFDNMEIKSVTDNEVVIIGYASVYNIADHHNVKFLWQHDSKKLSELLLIWLKMTTV